MELTYIKPGATFAVGKNRSEMLHGMFNADPLFLSLQWRVRPVVSLPQEVEASARYDCPILTTRQNPYLCPLLQGDQLSLKKLTRSIFAKILIYKGFVWKRCREDTKILFPGRSVR